MRIRLFLFFVAFFSSAFALFGMVIFDDARERSKQENETIIQTLFAPVLAELEHKIGLKTQPINEIKLDRLPNKSQLHIIQQEKIVASFPNTSTMLAPQYLVWTRNISSGIFETENKSYYWFKQPVGNTDFYALQLYEAGLEATFDLSDFTGTFIVTFIIILWSSAWSSQYLGNLFRQLEDKKFDLNRNNQALEDSLNKLEQQQSQLQIARDHALAANQTKSSFLANMSHELRTPLNAIIGYSEMIYEDIKDKDSVLSSDIEKILASGNHLLGLINDILDLSKIEAGKMDTYIEIVDLYRVIHDIAASIMPLINKNNNILTIQCSETIGTIKTDITKLRQILFNLINNANKFTHEGVITISVKRILLNNKDVIQFKVQDTGIGMSSDQVEKLFQAFTQADASTTRKYGGTGLGLTISQHLANMLGGDIQVQSQETIGSTFTVTLATQPSIVSVHDEHAHIGPKVDARKVRLTPTQTSKGVRRKKVSTILVIDDDADIRDLMERYLSRQGFNTISAANADEGINLAKQLLPDLITLDIMMPEKDGWQALTEIKSTDTLKMVPVILLTLAGNKELGLSLGAAEHISKPINWSILMEAILKHIRQPKRPDDD